jgi:hypothetical protein
VKQIARGKSGALVKLRGGKSGALRGMATYYHGEGKEQRIKGKERRIGKTQRGKERRIEKMRGERAAH